MRRRRRECWTCSPHLLEATLALYDATKSPEALAAVREIGDFLLYKMLQGRPDGSAYFPEWYSTTWEPLPQNGGGYIDIGHQVENRLPARCGRERGGYRPSILPPRSE
jgi:mannose/cellobiose epimerase-like protein (N-acyl-D-glucosamine 2-epimerase family)